MDDSTLPEPLRSELQHYLQQRPTHRPTIERMIERHVAAKSDKERLVVERSLEWLIDPKRGRKGFGWAIGLVILAMGGSVVGVVHYRRSQLAQAIAAGTPVTAQVTRLEPTSCFDGNKGAHCVTLSLQVYPEGRAPYSASFTQAISLTWMSRVQPGSWLTVVVDPNHPQQVVFDEDSLQLAPPSPPPNAP